MGSKDLLIYNENKLRVHAKNYRDDSGTSLILKLDFPPLDFPITTYGKW